MPKPGGHITVSVTVLNAVIYARTHNAKFPKFEYLNRSWQLRVFFLSSTCAGRNRTWGAGEDESHVRSSVFVEGGLSHPRTSVCTRFCHSRRQKFLHDKHLLLALCLGRIVMVFCSVYFISSERFFCWEDLGNDYGLMELLRQFNVILLDLILWATEFLLFFFFFLLLNVKCKM